MSPSLTWGVSPVDDKRQAKLLDGVLSQLAAEFCSRFGFSQSENVPLKTTHWQLLIGDSYADDTLSEVDRQGAGELTHANGFEPILFFAALRKRLGEAQKGYEKLISFSDEEGKEVNLIRWSDVECQMQRLGFTPNEVAWAHQQAQAIKFTDAPFFSSVVGNSSTFF